MSEPKPLTDPDLHNQALGMIRDAYCVTIKWDDVITVLGVTMSPSAARALGSNRRRKKPKPQ